MEDVDSPELKIWIDAENDLTQKYLAQIPLRETMQPRLTALLNFERYTAPSRRGTRYFYSHNSGLQNQNVLFWQEGLTGEPHVLLDPNTFSADGTVAISSISITDDGALAAYSIADAGSDWVKWHVRNVTTGEDLPDLIEWSKFSGAAWLKDNSGFFYARYEPPRPTHPKPKPSRPPTTFTRSTSTSSARRSPKTHSSSIAPTTANSTSAPGHRRRPLPRPRTKAKAPAPTTNSPYRTCKIPTLRSSRLIDTPDATYAPIDNDGTLFWLLTTLDAPNGKVIAIDLNQPSTRALEDHHPREPRTSSATSPSSTTPSS